MKTVKLSAIALVAAGVGSLAALTSCGAMVGADLSVGTSGAYYPSLSYNAWVNTPVNLGPIVSPLPPAPQPAPGNPWGPGVNPGINIVPSAGIAAVHRPGGGAPGGGGPGPVSPGRPQL